MLFTQKHIQAMLVPSLEQVSVAVGDLLPQLVLPDIELPARQIMLYTHEVSKIQKRVGFEREWLALSDDEIMVKRDGRWTLRRVPHLPLLLPDTIKRFEAIKATVRNRNKKLKETTPELVMPAEDDPNFITVFRAVLVRLYPGQRKNIAMCRHAGARRFVFALGLEQRSERKGKARDWHSRPGGTNYQAQCKELTQCKLLEDYAWLNEIHSQVLQQALVDLNDAFTKFFKGEAGYPKKPRKGRHDSFRYPSAESIELRRTGEQSGLIYLPKIGWVKLRGWTDLPGKMLSVTVRRHAGKWYAAVQCEVRIPKPQPSDKEPGGVDVNIANHHGESDGTIVGSGQFGKKAKRNLARAQGNLARKKPGSHNRLKAKWRVAGIHKKIADARKDFNHKQSRRVVDKYSTVFMEDLRIRNMTASAKGTVDEPGRNVAQKSGLNRAFLDQGHGQFRTFVGYKAFAQGESLYLVPPHHTSQDCSKCGFRSAANRPSQAVFACQRCGFKEHADVNSACNIKQRGIRMLALGKLEPEVKPRVKPKRMYRKKAKDTENTEQAQA